VTSLNLSEKDVKGLRVDALVVGVARVDGDPILVEGPALPKRLRSSLSDSLKGLGVTGKADQVVKLTSGGEVAAPVIVLTGLGDASGTRRRRPTVSTEALRRAAGAATRSLAGTGSVGLALPADGSDEVAAVAEGALFGAYGFLRHRGRTADDVKRPVAAVTVVTDLAKDKGVKASATRAEHLATAIHLTRDLVNTAPGDLPPAAFADAVVDAAKGAPVKVTVLDEKALTKGGYGGIMGVGKGSSRPPRLVKVEYAPRGAKGHLAFVGKGITFDSGGLSLKPPASMETMKSDMAGAAAVIAAVLAIARLGIKTRVTVWAPMAENMPSGAAQRPSDVLDT
jgi:leucyl aminopeptidase